MESVVTMFQQMERSLSQILNTVINKKHKSISRYLDSHRDISTIISFQ